MRRSPRRGCLKMNCVPMKFKDGQAKTPPLRYCGTLPFPESKEGFTVYGLRNPSTERKVAGCQNRMSSRLAHFVNSKFGRRLSNVGFAENGSNVRWWRIQGRSRTVQMPSQMLLPGHSRFLLTHRRNRTQSSLLSSGSRHLPLISALAQFYGTLRLSGF